jgi:hypothetical protein
MVSSLHRVFLCLMHGRALELTSSVAPQTALPLLETTASCRT